MQAVENDSPVASVGQGLPSSSPSSSPSSPSGLGHPGGQAEVGRFGCLGGQSAQLAPDCSQPARVSASPAGGSTPGRQALQGAKEKSKRIHKHPSAGVP